MKITIGTPVYDDYSGLEMTLTSLQLHHDLTDVELIVVDNHPTTQQDRGGKIVESDVTRKIRQETEAAGGRYIAMPEPRGTAAPRNRLFTEATGDVVIVIDSHVMLAPSLLPAVRQYFANSEHAYDLVQGPILARRRHPSGHGLQAMGTHYADVWRSEMWGIWSQAWQCHCGQWHFDVTAELPAAAPIAFAADGSIVATPPQISKDPVCVFHGIQLGDRDAPLTACPACGQSLPSGLPYARHDQSLEARGYRRRCWDPDDTEPFDIAGLGLGMFAARREAWLAHGGFPAGMIGFGGGELHLHEQVRRHGGRTVCHPLCGWWHRFERDAVPYHAGLWEKVRNYVIWRKHLDMPLTPVKQHFVNNPALKTSLNEAQWQHLLADPFGNASWPGDLVESPKPATAAAKTNRPQPPESAKTIEVVYDWVLTTKRDCVSHLPAVRELASKCFRVVSLVKRREWDVAVLAGNPDEYYSHNTEQDQLLNRLAADFFYEARDASDSLAVEPIGCDLLLIDTVHSSERLRAELTRWTPHVARWIAIRGTKAFGAQAEGKKAPGLDAAIDDLISVGTWKRVYREDTQYGLTVLSCDPSERSIDRGVGHELSKLYKSLGINPPADCTCRALSNRMDALGPAGCREHESELVTAMEENAAKYKWTDTLKAGWKALGSGLVLKINPLDPLRSCLRIAIERTEADDAAWEARCDSAV